MPLTEGTYGQLHAAIASTLRESRRVAGVSATEFGARIGLSQSSVSRYERGVLTPTVQLVKKWAIAAGATGGQQTELAEQAKRLAATLERSVDVVAAVSSALVLWLGTRLVLREELTADDEESVVRRLLTRLREPIWKKTSMPQKLVVAKTLQAKIRQPVPKWGTAVFALAAYTCPLWLILPGVLLGLLGSAARDEAAADRRAAAAGLRPDPIEVSAETVAE